MYAVDFSVRLRVLTEEVSATRYVTQLSCPELAEARAEQSDERKADLNLNFDFGFSTSSPACPHALGTSHFGSYEFHDIVLNVEHSASFLNSLPFSSESGNRVA